VAGNAQVEGRLEVRGDIYHRGRRLWPDYVFEPGYQLESIEDHAHFMWMHKHLKAIPRSKVDENGQEIVELGVQCKGIVEELEKAHIHIEQLHQRIKVMERRDA
jgi:hypothetical protein